MGVAPVPAGRPSLAGRGEVFFGVSSPTAGPSLVLRAGTGAGGASPLSSEGAAERVEVGLLDAEVAIGGAARGGAGLALAVGATDVGVDLPLEIALDAVGGVAVPDEAAAA
jgi:hypothetical protein